MSRRRSSATALKASEVVAALGMDSIYSHIGICQADSLAGFLPFLSGLSETDAGRGMRRPYPKWRELVAKNGFPRSDWATLSSWQGGSCRQIGSQDAGVASARAAWAAVVCLSKSVTPRPIMTNRWNKNPITILFSSGVRTL